MSRRYIDKSKTDKNGIRIITLRNILREKIGFGGLDPVVLERAEEFLENNTVDYQPVAVDLRNTLAAAIETAESKPVPARSGEIISAITAPVMKLKASGGMFRYPMITEIADIILGFMEGLDRLDDDALEILAVHQKILNVIIAEKLTGDGGPAGRALADELYSACARYDRKHNRTPASGG